MYTKELVDEVKELYPNNSEMITAAEAGSVWLGRYLCDSIPNGVDVDIILKAKSLMELQALTIVIKRKQDLYHKWCQQDPRKKEQTLHF